MKLSSRCLFAGEGGGVCVRICVWAFLALHNNMGNAGDSALIPQSGFPRVSISIQSAVYGKCTYASITTNSLVLNFLPKAFYFKKNKPQAYSLPFLKLSSLAVD